MTKTRQKAKFGIVMPTRNQADFIRDGILSILEQEGVVIDLFVVDGNSTDRTVKVLEDLTIEIENLHENKRNLNFTWKWISEPDAGQSDALNKGFHKIDGDILCWLNSDDRLMPNTLKKVSEEFANNQKIDVVCGAATALNKQGQVQWVQTPQSPTFESLLIEGECPPQPSIFWRKNLALKVGDINKSLKYTMDYELWIRFVFAGAKFKTLTDIFSVQIYHDQSKSMEGAFIFEKFLPERQFIQRSYKRKAPLRTFLYITKFKLKISGLKAKKLIATICSRLAPALKRFLITRKIGSVFKQHLNSRPWGKKIIQKFWGLKG